MKRRMMLFLLCAFCMQGTYAETTQTLDLEYATLELDSTGKARLVYAEGGVEYVSSCAFQLTTEDDRCVPVASVKAAGETLLLEFNDGSMAEMATRAEKGFALFTLKKFTPKSPIKEFLLFQLGIPKEGKYVSTINNCLYNGTKTGVMTASLNVRPYLSSSTREAHSREGCSHTFLPKSREGGGTYAEFVGVSNRDGNDGWAVRGRAFDKPMDLTGCKGIRAEVRGDANREALKIQLYSKPGGHRDDYLTIDFTGWKTVTLTSPALNDLQYNDVRGIRFYYNGMPAKKTSTCGIDNVRAVFANDDGTEREVPLVSFESERDGLWEDSTKFLSVSSYARHEIAPASFGVIASPEAAWKEVVQAFQAAAGLPSPRPAGGWRNDSPWIKQSYFFLTGYNENQYLDALKIARRGGFKQILLLQHSWCKTPGHYEVNTKNFQGGLDGLRKHIEKFRAEGIRFGLHFLAASIDPPDPYLTPIPEERLVMGLETTLAADLSADAKQFAVTGDSTTFPILENPYTGQGQVLRIDDELILYGKNENGFSECRRGYLGTKAAAHTQGAKVRQVVKAYGYYMYDLDSTLREEVAANFAKLANQLPLDMLYFDGSEKLQRRADGRDHWYYNAKLHRAFYDAVDNKNILYQASSFSPYSWNLLGRSASADGHDDLKAYLDERSPAFTYFEQSEMPLDVGWYYGYDAKATPDMYEYVLGATIGYNASMSFQVSPVAAFRHPFIYEILDLIRRYEELRLSGRVPAELRKRFRIDPVLGGSKTVEARNALLDKRIEFHLTEQEGECCFRRVKYPLWHEVNPADPATREWTLDVTEPALVGFQIQFIQGDKTDKTVVNPQLEIDGKRIALPMTLENGQYGFALPTEPLTQYGLPLAEPKKFAETTPEIRLAPGRHTVKFTCESGADVAVRVRTPLWLDEIVKLGRDLPPFEVRDWHIHLRGGMTAEKAIKRQRRTGILSGVLENSGREWPLSDNAKLQAFLDHNRAVAKAAGVPLPIGMQVNDRDWFTYFDKKILDQLDYVLSDTMVMNDETGKPVRLWLTDTYTIDDEEAWMERYFQHCMTVAGEPITILANPTYLPPQLADRYHHFWTRARMEKLIDRVVENGVALEIQADSNFPDETFLRMAKARGAKFSFGSNNFNDAMKNLDRWGQRVRECGLEEADFIKTFPKLPDASAK
ncbi:MAG: hypothetical protein Q4D98_03180 [Planctomycetia bacterium]|nr:hypothetical protein [Planctomycetia bacterium]